MSIETQNEKHPLTVRFITLGCPKNLVDSEVMAGHLKKAGLTLAPDQMPADIGIINTCGFIEASKKESIESIFKLAEEKKKGNLKLIVVAGCLSQRYKEELPSLIPEVDAFVGTADFSRLPGILLKKMEGESCRNFIRDPEELMTARDPRQVTTPRFSRYVKISEGCSHSCSFCTIPLMRGGLKSRGPEDIAEEIRQGAAEGVKEFNLIAHDLNEYGRDLPERKSLTHLLELIGQEPGDFWVRLLYMYPLQFPDKLISLIRNHPHVVPYVDIPLQHIDDEILKSMKRGSSSRYIYRLIDKLRKEIPSIVLRTTFIAGYPGETEPQFEKLVRFVKEVEFDRMGAFTYSQEEGTPAALLGKQLPDRVKNERRDLLMQTQQAISLKKNKNCVGKTLKVLCEGKKSGRFYGQAPEIDGEILIRSKGKKRPHPPKAGSFINVKIDEASPYDLKGICE